MKKSTNKYRRCANCPHSAAMQRKCCCQASSASTMRNKAVTSRPKKEPSTIDNSSIVNTTIPTIIAQFSALRTQNNQLKRELLNVSTFLKDDGHNSISIHHAEPTLSEKLFIANKNLKESLIQIDNLSKMNKELFDRNTQLTQLSEGLKIQLRQMENYLDKYKRKCKKYSKTIEEIPNRDKMQSVIKKNLDFQQQILTLRQEIRCLKFENKNFSMIGNLSPQWVAHTNNKMSKHDHAGRVQQQSKQIDMEAFKRSLSQTINLLKNENSHFTSTSYDSIGQVDVIGIEDLIKNLISTYSESIFGHFTLLVKQMNRKLNTYQKKLSNLTSKLQNFIIIVRNKRLKKRFNTNNMSFIKTQRHPMADLTNRIL